jgi:hypothetical protein
VTTTLRKPTLAQTTTIIFGVATPDARFLVGFEGVLKAVFLDDAGAAD